MLQTRPPNAEERDWLHWLGQLPCIVCQHFHGVNDTPAEIHHLEGRNKALCHLRSIPLCTNHHRRPDTQRPKRWLARHGDAKGLFEARYALEFELLELTQQEVEKLKTNHVGSPTCENY